MELVADEQVVVVVAGRQRQVRLVPVRALDSGDVEWIKVAETKACITFSTGVMCHAPQPIYCLCVAIKRQVFFYCHYNSDHNSNEFYMTIIC